MVDKQVTDFSGTISRISDVREKKVTSKKDNKEYTFYELGVLLDSGGSTGENWYNASASSEAKAKTYLHCQKLDRDYQVGDKVKIYLESKEGKYWRITSIVLLESAPNSAESNGEDESSIPEEMIEENTSSIKTSPKPMTKEDFWARKEKREIENTLRISRHGAINTAIDAMKLAAKDKEIDTTAEELIEVAKKLADDIIKYVNAG